MAIRLIQETRRPGRSEPDDERQRLIERLVASAGRRAYAIARDLLGNAAEAEDAVQESLAVACESIGTVRDPRAIDGWFFRVVTNHCLRSLRRRRLRRALLGRREHAVDDAPTGGTEAELARRRGVARMLRALETLPVKQRAALVLRYGHDMSVRDVAATLDVQPATAKTHIVRGLHRLRRIMEEMK